MRKPDWDALDVLWFGMWGTIVVIGLWLILTHVLKSAPTDTSQGILLPWPAP